MAAGPAVASGWLRPAPADCSSGPVAHATSVFRAPLSSRLCASERLGKGFGVSSGAIGVWGGVGGGRLLLPGPDSNYNWKPPIKGDAVLWIRRLDRGRSIISWLLALIKFGRHYPFTRRRLRPSLLFPLLSPLSPPLPSPPYLLQFSDPISLRDPLQSVRRQPRPAPPRLLLTPSLGSI